MDFDAWPVSTTRPAAESVVTYGGAELDGVVRRLGHLRGGVPGVDGGLGGDMGEARRLRRCRQSFAGLLVRLVRMALGGLGPSICLVGELDRGLRLRSGVLGGFDRVRGGARRGLHRGVGLQLRCLSGIRVGTGALGGRFGTSGRGVRVGGCLRRRIGGRTGPPGGSLGIVGVLGRRVRRRTGFLGVGVGLVGLRERFFRDRLGACRVRLLLRVPCVVPQVASLVAGLLGCRLLLDRRSFGGLRLLLRRLRLRRLGLGRPAMLRRLGLLGRGGRLLLLGRLLLGLRGQPLGVGVSSRRLGVRLRLHRDRQLGLGRLLVLLGVVPVHLGRVGRRLGLQLGGVRRLLAELRLRLRGLRQRALRDGAAVAGGRAGGGLGGLACLHHRLQRGRRTLGDLRLLLTDQQAAATRRAVLVRDGVGGLLRGVGGGGRRLRRGGVLLQDGELRLRPGLGGSDAFLRLLELGLLRIGGAAGAVVAGRLDGELLRRGAVASPQPRVMAVLVLVQVQALARAYVLQGRGGTDVRFPRLRRAVVARPDLNLGSVVGLGAGHVQTLLGVDVHQVQLPAVAVKLPLLCHRTVARVHLDRSAVGVLAALDVEALAVRATHLDDRPAVADPADTTRRPVVLPDGETVREPRMPQHFPERLRTGGECLGCFVVGVQQLVALHGLRGDLPLPLGGGGGAEGLEDLVRVERVTPGAGREPGLQVLDRDAELGRTRGGGGAGEASGGEEDAGVVRAGGVDPRRAQPLEGGALDEGAVPLVRGERRVGVLRVELGAEIADGLACRVVRRRSRVLVEVALGLPEPVGDPLGQPGLGVEVLAVVGSRRPVEIGRTDSAWGLQPVERLPPAVPDGVEGVQLLARGLPVLGVRLRERRVLPVLPVGQGVEFVLRLVQAVLRDGGHGRSAQAQHVGHQALVLPQLFRGGVVVPVVGVARRGSALPGELLRRSGPGGQAAEDGERRHGRDEGGEYRNFACSGSEQPWSGAHKTSFVVDKGSRGGPSEEAEPVRADQAVVPASEQVRQAAWSEPACVVSRCRGMTVHPSPWRHRSPGRRSVCAPRWSGQGPPRARRSP
jgi:hypothetical protein